MLNPNTVIAPVEPAETIIKLIPDDIPLDDLVVRGLRQRPELAGAQEQVTAALVRWKQAKMRPFIPSLGLTTAGGGFGGGPNAFFGNFGTANRRRGQPVLGTAKPRLRRSCDHAPPEGRT